MNQKRPLPILVPKASQQKRSREARHTNLPGHQNQFQHLPQNLQNPRFPTQNLPPFDFPSSVQNGLQASSQLMPYQPPGPLNPGFPPLNPAHHVQNANEFRNFSHFVPHPGPLQQPFPRQPVPQNTQLALQGPPNFQLPPQGPTNSCQQQPGLPNFEQYQQRPPGMFPLSQPPPSQFDFLPLPQLPGDKFQMQLTPSQNMLQAQQHLQQGPSGNSQIMTTSPSQVVPLPPPQNVICQNCHEFQQQKFQMLQAQQPFQQIPSGNRQIMATPPSQVVPKFGPSELQMLRNVLSQLTPLPGISSTSQVGPVPGAHDLPMSQMSNAQEHVLQDLLNHSVQHQLARKTDPAPLQNPAMPLSQQRELPFDFPLLAQPITCLAPKLPIQGVPSSISDVRNVSTDGLSELQALQSQNESARLQPVKQPGPEPLHCPEMPILYPEGLAQCSQDQLPQGKLPPSQPPNLVSQLQDNDAPDYRKVAKTAPREPQVLQNPLEHSAQLQETPPTLEVSKTGLDELDPLPRTVSIPDEVPNSDMVYQKVLKILQQASHEMLKPMQDPQPDPAQLEITKHSAILKHLFGTKSLDKFHRDPSSLPHHFQFQLLTVPPHVPAPQTLEHLEEIVKFNEDMITKKSSKEEWILEKLESFGALHKKKIDLFKSCEFREDFLVKLYYKYHQILIGSSSTNAVVFDDMEPYKKWMCTNAHCHREMVEVAEKLRESDEDGKKQVMKELRKAVKRSTKRLDPMFWRGLEQIQDVMLTAIGKPEIAAIVRREIKRGIRQLERAQNEPAVVDQSDVEDYEEVGDRRENEETSRVEPEVAPHSSMAPHSEKRKEKDGLVDGQEEHEDEVLSNFASTAKPQEIEDVSPGSSEDQLGSEVSEPSTPPTTQEQEPEAAIEPPVGCIPSTSNLSPSPQTTQKSETTSNSKIYNVPIDLTMDTSQLEIVFALVKELAEETRLKESKVVILTNEQAKLKLILDDIKENSDKLSRLNIQKSKALNRKEEQESSLRRIVIKKKEVGDSITILKIQMEEHIHFVKEAEEEVEMNKQNYEEKVKESEEYSQEVFVVKNSGSILADVWRAIDSMETSRFASLCSHVKERRKLMEDLQMKMNVVVDGKKEIEKIEEKTGLAEEKLKRTELKEKEESERLEREKEELQKVEEEIESFENEKTKLEEEKKEKMRVVKGIESEIELINRACKNLEEQIHCSEKSKQTKSAMISPTYPLDYIPDSSTQDAPAFLGLRDNTLGYNGLPSSSNLTSFRKLKNTHGNLGQGSSPTPQHQSYLRRLISREFSNSRPRIILKISREKFREADRIRREQERMMGNEEEEEIERGMNDGEAEGGGEEDRPQQNEEAVNDKIEGRRTSGNKTKRRSLDGNVCDREGASPPKQRKDCRFN